MWPGHVCFVAMHALLHGFALCAWCLAVLHCKDSITSGLLPCLFPVVGSSVLHLFLPLCCPAWSSLWRCRTGVNGMEALSASPAWQLRRVADVNQRASNLIPCVCGCRTWTCMDCGLRAAHAWEERMSQSAPAWNCCEVVSCGHAGTSLRNSSTRSARVWCGVIHTKHTEDAAGLGFEAIFAPTCNGVLAMPAFQRFMCAVSSHLLWLLCCHKWQRVELCKGWLCSFLCAAVRLLLTC
ncbi:hypothetical protein COO60DRAFT_1697891 [Scenedesmus sp. NREL 46B-D3]|nr:hypothetical protein COO60DRAFT_1697891 [Scenedesmus sp. NREL 46B-D3]